MLNNKFLAQKLYEARIEASLVETVLIETPWWRLLRNRSLRKKIARIDKLISTYYVDYEHVMDASLSEQEQRKWADPFS
jgi:nicotinic acid phosphoribosyltransferase